MDQQKSDDTKSDNKPGSTTSRSGTIAHHHNHHHGLHFSRTGADNHHTNKIYAELFHAGFRPPQSFPSDRATKRRIHRCEENASDDDDEEDDAGVAVEDENRDGGRRRPRRTNIPSSSSNTKDVDLDQQDSKPRAIDKTQLLLRSDEVTSAVVLHRQPVITKAKKQKGNNTNLTKKGKSPPGQQQQQEPLQLYHRLFEPIGGKKKRQRIIIIDGNDKDSKINTTTTNNNNSHPHRKARSTTASTKVIVDNSDHDPNKDTKNNSNTTTTPAVVETPVVVIPVVELPPFAVIRGSITHQILQKLNRLDTKLLFDDPYQTGSSSSSSDKNEVGDTNNYSNSKDLLTKGENVSRNETNVPQPTTTTTVLNENGDTPTNGIHVKPHSERHHVTPAAVTEESICLRSTIIPQQQPPVIDASSQHTHRLHVVILYGKYRGRTGYVVDEVDGRYFVIQSDDPEDIQHGVTWTVSTTHVCTVAEFLAEQQPCPTSTAAAAVLLPPKKNPFINNASSPGATTSDKSSKDYELFMSCLERELALERQH